MMNACQSCGCSPCKCGGGTPAVLANTQLINPLLTGATLDGGTLNGAAINSPNIVGAQIDCTSRGCTAGTGVCNDGLATNAFVCNSVANAISSSNAAFCGGLADCIAGDPTILCPAVVACINTAPGIINNTSAFGFNARATTALYGVARFATGLELQNGSCLLALDPCTLIAAWNTPSLGTPFWNAFASAVNQAVGGVSLCAAVAACGLAPLASPVFTGDPRAPTPAPGDSDTSIATTAFVGAAVAAAISGSNPAFCAAVTACGGGGGGSSAYYAKLLVDITTLDPGFAGPGSPVITSWNVIQQVGCIGSFTNILDFINDHAAVTLTFTTPLANPNYVVTVATMLVQNIGSPPFPAFCPDTTTAPAIVVASTPGPATPCVPSAPPQVSRFTNSCVVNVTASRGVSIGLPSTVWRLLITVQN